jgi:hypothetical protein
LFFVEKEILLAKLDPMTHGSLEAILSLTKMTQKTETGNGCGVMSGVLNNGF